MLLSVTLIGNFYCSHSSQPLELEVNLNSGSDIKDLFHLLNIPSDVQTITLVNGRPVQKGRILAESDRVTLLRGVEGG